MGEMASQIQAAIEADPSGLPGGSEAPGSEGVQAPPTPPPAAEPSTPDSGAAGGTPETIPYARFKEVNDRYNAVKGYEDLATLGYDPDSLGQLAAFGVAYEQDPVGTWMNMADNLELPQEVKDALAASNASSGRAEGEPSSDGQKPLELPPEVQQRLDYVDQLRARDEQRDRNDKLDAVVREWDRMDKQDEIETPELIKLMAISATASSGQQFQTAEAIAQAARATIVDYRSGVLQGAVSRTGRGGSPPALPGSSLPPSPGRNFGADIKAASRAAMEAMERGELPSIQGG